MTRNPKNYWFKRRRYGYGWFPVKWQGWLSVVVFLAAAIGTAFVVLPPKPQQPDAAQLSVFLGGLAIYVLAIIAVGITKGPVPHWRWGKKPTDNPDEDI